jgi:predicted nucleic acid-binding protein
MMVVSNTTPLNYLILTESVHVLPAIFGRVYAPSAVIEELSHPRSPPAVRAWADSPPQWLTVQDPTHIDPSLKLGVGEAAAISMALELKADRVLIDDRDASREARRSGLSVVGSLGILEEAARRGLIDIEQKIKELEETNFRASQALYRSVLERVREQMPAQAPIEPKPEPSPPEQRRRLKHDRAWIAQRLGSRPALFSSTSFWRTEPAGAASAARRKSFAAKAGSPRLFS